MIAVVEYGVGNLYSLLSSLKAVGADAVVTDDPARFREARGIILPGVGAFGDAMDALRKRDLVDVLKAEANSGKPFMGICLGMQLLFRESMEFGCHQGLGLLDGRILPLEGQVGDLKVPHMGWNSLHMVKDHPLLKNTREGEYVYYVHSYAGAECEDSLLASSPYGIHVPGVVGKDNVMGTQFHPEKSGRVGLRILSAFCDIVKGEDR